MLTGQSGVKYGLTVPKKQAKEPVKKQINVFGDDNESEDDRTLVEKQIKRQARQKQTDKKVTYPMPFSLALTKTLGSDETAMHLASFGHTISKIF